MKQVFISWSGETAKKIAVELSNWLQLVLQNTKTFFSEDNICKGAFTFPQLQEAIEKSDAAIVIITPDNINQPWIVFETGYLQGRKKRTYGLLFNMKHEQLSGPLQSIQNTLFTRDDFFKMLESIKKECQPELTREQLSKIYNKMWDDLNSRVEKIIQNSCTDSTTPEPLVARMGQSPQTETLTEAERTRAHNLLLLLNACSILRHDVTIDKIAARLHMDQNYTKSLIAHAMKKGLLLSHISEYSMYVNNYEISPKGTTILTDMGLYTANGPLTDEDFRKTALKISDEQLSELNNIRRKI